MERLLSIAVHNGLPEVQLSKVEKAAILQTTVSSPVKSGDGGGGDGKVRNISVINLGN